MRLVRYYYCVLVCAWQTIVASNGFSVPPHSTNGRHGGGSGKGRSLPSAAHSGGGDDPHVPSSPIWMKYETLQDEDDDDDEHLESDELSWNLVTSSSSTQQLVASNSRTEKVNATPTNLSLSSTRQYWNNALTSLGNTLKKPFRKAHQAIRHKFRSPQQKVQEEMMQTLLTTPVRHVVITPETTVLPSTVVHIAARRSGLLGQPLGIDRVQEFARSIQRWYMRQGYVLHSVTGATLVPETGTAEIRVQEPTTADEPVRIVFCKEMVVDPETGDIVSFRQYSDKHTQRRTLGFSSDKIARNDLNWTYVPTPVGRTRPRRIAAALELAPGEHFRWNESRWRKIVGSGIFKKVLQAAPKTVDNGTVQLQILVHEAPPRHLEYGLSKSLYTGDWEGELDFEHVNVLGGGESLGFTFRRGTKGPSGRLRFSDDRFGLEGGYDVELFSDYIGDNGDKINIKASAIHGDSLADTPALQVVEAKGRGPLLDHRSGATFRLRNPIDRKLMLNSVATASVEHVTTAAGSEESIASTSLGIGPFVRQLPRGARSNLDARIMLGSRFPGHQIGFMGRKNRINKEANESDSMTHFTLPYSSIMATTRQIFPIMSSSKMSTRPIVLALRHSVVTSTKSLPKHEGRAQGLTCNIRGADDIGSISSAITGTTEIRVPITLPIDNTAQDASIVLFGDWVFAKESTSPAYIKKSSIGLGLRKTMQGIPLKVNVSYLRGEGKIKSTFGLGHDFDV